MRPADGPVVVGVAERADVRRRREECVLADKAATGCQRRARGWKEAVDARIARAFELVVSRAPTISEMQRLRRLHDESLAALRVVQPAAENGSGSAGSPASGSSDLPEASGAGMRALRSVTTAILNLDAALVR